MAFTITKIFDPVQTVGKGSSFQVRFPSLSSLKTIGLKVQGMMLSIDNDSANTVIAVRRGSTFVGMGFVQDRSAGIVLGDEFYTETNQVTESYEFSFLTTDSDETKIRGVTLVCKEIL